LLLLVFLLLPLLLHLHHLEWLWDQLLSTELHPDRAPLERRGPSLT
jgi:hypothetical protein